MVVPEVLQVLLLVLSLLQEGQRAPVLGSHAVACIEALVQFQEICVDRLVLWGLAVQPAALLERRTLDQARQVRNTRHQGCEDWAGSFMALEEERGESREDVLRGEGRVETHTHTQ